METIKDLLSKLNNKVTPSMAKRLDGLQDLQEKLEDCDEETKQMNMLKIMTI